MYYLTIVFETGSHVAQPDIQIAIYPRMTLTSGPPGCSDYLCAVLGTEPGAPCLLIRYLADILRHFSLSETVTHVCYASLCTVRVVSS